MVAKQVAVLILDAMLVDDMAAEKGDRFRAQEHFQGMVSGCLGCHAAYRQRVGSLLTDGGDKIQLTSSTTAYDDQPA